MESKLNNGLTEDLREIKGTVKELSHEFRLYKENRESTCPIRKDDYRGKLDRRAKMAMIISAVAVFVAMTGVVLGNVI
jgi:hypothetical protein